MENNSQAAEPRKAQKLVPSGSQLVSLPRISMLVKSDYLDPETRHDRLPQPYRMLDKLLNQIIDNAIEIADKIEVEKETKQVERENPRLPVHHHFASFGETPVTTSVGLKGNIFYGTINGEVVVVEPKTKTIITRIQVFQQAPVLGLCGVSRSSIYADIGNVSIIVAYNEKSAQVLSLYNNSITSYITIDFPVGVTQIKLSSDGQLIYAATMDGNVEIFRLNQSPHVLEQAAEEDTVYSSIRLQSANSPGKQRPGTSKETSRAASASVGSGDKKSKDQGPVVAAKAYTSILKLSNPFNTVADSDAPVKTSAPSPIPVADKKTATPAVKAKDAPKDLKSKKAPKPSTAAVEKTKPKANASLKPTDDDQPPENFGKSLPIPTAHFVNGNIETRRVVYVSGIPSFWKRTYAVAKSLVLWWSGANRLLLYTLPSDESTPPAVNPAPEKTFTLAHTITCSEVDRIGRFVVTGHQDGSSIVWDMSLGIDVYLLSKHKAPVSAVTFYLQSHVIAGSSEGVVNIYDLLASGRCTSHRESLCRIDYLASLTDTPIAVAMAQDGAIRLYSVFDRKIIAKLGLMTPWKMKSGATSICSFDNFISLMAFKEMEPESKLESTKLLVFFMGDVIISRTPGYSTPEFQRQHNEMSSTPLPPSTSAENIQSDQSESSRHPTNIPSILPMSQNERVRKLLAEKQQSRFDREARIAKRQTELRREVRAAMGLPPDPSDVAVLNQSMTSKQGLKSKRMTVK